MPEIYEPLSVEGHELCQPERQEDYDTISDLIDGTSRAKIWRPIPMRLVHVDEGKKLAPSDAPWLGSDSLIFRRSVVEKLGSILSEYGELLPVACSETELWIFNPTRVLDALDEQGSTVRRFSSGSVMRVTRYMFRAEAIVGVDIFKIPHLRVSPTFVSGRFVQLWRSAGLVGLEFKKIWSS